MSVNDQQLAVIALIQFPDLACRQRIDGVELEQVDAAVGHVLEEGGRRAESADTVPDDVDLHALPLPGDQCLCKAFADLIVVEDVGLHVDVILRRQDGGVHRLIGGRSILEQQHLIAGGQRRADDGLLERQVAVEDIGVLAPAFQAVEDHLALCAGQRTVRPFQLDRRTGRLAQVRHDGWQAAAAGQPETARAGRAPVGLPGLILKLFAGDCGSPRWEAVRSSALLYLRRHHDLRTLAYWPSRLGAAFPPPLPPACMPPACAGCLVRRRVACRSRMTGRCLGARRLGRPAAPRALASQAPGPASRAALRRRGGQRGRPVAPPVFRGS